MDKDPFLLRMLCYVIAYIVYIFVGSIGILSGIIILVLIWLGTYGLFVKLFPDKIDLGWGIAFLFCAYFYYIFFGSGIVLYILVLIGIIHFLPTFFPNWELWTDKEQKVVVPPESNKCPNCGKKNREGVRFCNECGRSL
jgi:type IV secretory pathway TrbL component